VVLRFTVSELASLKVAAGGRAVSELCRERALGEAQVSAGSEIRSGTPGASSPAPASRRASALGGRVELPGLLHCPAPACGFAAASPKARCPVHGRTVK
jgi:hypothetical protein